MLWSKLADVFYLFAALTVILIASIVWLFDLYMFGGVGGDVIDSFVVGALDLVLRLVF